MWARCLSLLRGSTCGVVDLRRVGIVCLPATCGVCSAVPWLLPSVPGLFLALLGGVSPVSEKRRKQPYFSRLFLWLPGLFLAFLGAKNNVPG